MTVVEEKKILRAEIRAAERALASADKQVADAAIIMNVMSTDEYASAERIFAFVGTAREIDTRPLLAAALCAGKRLCVPRCIGDGIMELREISSLDDLIPGSFGILEPPLSCPLVGADAVELALVPCLSCNHVGARLGQGGGFYDRFAEKYSGASFLLCREVLTRDNIPTQAHDARFPVVITDAGVFRNLI